MVSGSKQIFPRFKGQHMSALVNGRSMFTAKNYLFEYEPNSSVWQECSNPSAITITPILETTGKQSYHFFCLPNDPELLREIAEYLEDLSYKIEQDTESLKAEHEEKMDRLRDLTRKP